MLGKPLVSLQNVKVSTVSRINYGCQNQHRELKCYDIDKSLLIIYRYLCILVLVLDSVLSVAICSVQVQFCSRSVPMKFIWHIFIVHYAMFFNSLYSDVSFA